MMMKITQQVQCQYKDDLMKYLLCTAPMYLAQDED